MINAELIEPLAEELYQALRHCTTVPPLRKRYPDMTIDDAYAISMRFIARRLQSGEKIVGKKIGMTSKVMQDLMGVYQPDFGILMNTMWVNDGDAINLQTMIKPRVEAEIALVLKRSLKGPGITPADVLDATEAIAPCFEIVDSRIDKWDLGIVDTVADNASCGVFVIGNARIDPRGLDMTNIHCKVFKNGAPISEGYSNAVQGSPLASVAWLANTLGSYGVSLDAGDVILSGSLVPLADAAAGDRFSMELVGLGGCSVGFR